MLGVNEMGKRKSNYIFAPEKQKTGRGGCLLTVLGLLLAVILAALLLNQAVNSHVALLEERVSVMGMDKTFEGFTVLHISDLHAGPIGSDMELWQSLLKGKAFQAVVMTGDMVGSDGNYEPMLTLIHTLKQLKPEAPVYFVAGDDDPEPVISTPEGHAGGARRLGARRAAEGAIYLDAPVRQEVGKRGIWFVPEYLYDVDAAGMVKSLTKQKEDMEALGQQYEAEGGASYRALCYRLGCHGTRRGCAAGNALYRSANRRNPCAADSGLYPHQPGMGG